MKLNRYLIKIINEYVNNYVIDFTDMTLEIKTNGGLYRKISNGSKIIRNKEFQINKIIYHNDFKNYEDFKNYYEDCENFDCCYIFDDYITDISNHIYDLYLNENLGEGQPIYNDDYLAKIGRKGKQCDYFNDYPIVCRRRTVSDTFLVLKKTQLSQFIFEILIYIEIKNDFSFWPVRIYYGKFKFVIKLNDLSNYL